MTRPPVRLPLASRASSKEPCSSPAVSSVWSIRLPLMASRSARRPCLMPNRPRDNASCNRADDIGKPRTRKCFPHCYFPPLSVRRFLLRCGLATTAKEVPDSSRNDSEQPLGRRIFSAKGQARIDRKHRESEKCPAHDLSHLDSSFSLFLNDPWIGRCWVRVPGRFKFH
jgi:hypothetical protein